MKKSLADKQGSEICYDWFHRHNQNPVRHQIEIVNGLKYFRKKRYLRCLTGFLTHLVQCHISVPPENVRKP